MKLQVPVTIEGVVITPEIHAVLKDIQGFPEWPISAVEDAETHILNDPDDNAAANTLEVLKALHSLKKVLKKFIPKQEGDNHE